MCVFFPFILDIKFVGRTSRGHTGGKSHIATYQVPSSVAVHYLKTELTYLSSQSPGVSIHHYNNSTSNKSAFRTILPCDLNDVQLADF